MLGRRKTSSEQLRCGQKNKHIELKNAKTLFKAQKKPQSPPINLSGFITMGNHFSVTKVLG